MALITIATDCSPDMNSLTHAPYISGLFAGEDLPVASPCYLKSSDGKVYNSGSSILTAGSTPAYVGFTADGVKSGQPVTLFRTGARFNYSTALSAGSPLWISGSPAGKLSDAQLATTDFAVAVAVSATDIVVIR